MPNDAERSAPSFRGVAACALLALLIHAGFAAAYVAAYRGDLSALVCVDEKNAGREPFEAIQVGFPNSGYDGQFYYVIARTPWSRQSPDAIDFPAYRHVRVLYPALAWLLCGGDPRGLLFVLPAINLLAIGGVRWCGALLARHYRRSLWWGLLLPFGLNVGMPALRDLTDPLAAAALVALLTAYLLDASTRQIVFWGLATLFSREQNAAILVLLIGDSLLRRRWTWAIALAGAAAVWCGWLVGLRLWYGDWPVAAANVSTPLSGIWYCVTHLAGQFGRPEIVNVIGLSLIFAQIATCLLLPFRGAERLTTAIALAGVALTLLGGAIIYQSVWSYGRVFLWMPLAMWLWSMQSGRRWPALVAAAAVVWPLMAAAQPWLRP